MTTVRRLALVAIAASSLVVGVWAQGFPHSFYDNFPGFGRVWVAVDGPFNEHLIRDVGGLNLGLAFVAVVALISGTTLLARTAGGAALVYGLPHLLYHATHLDPFNIADKVVSLTALGLAVVAALIATTAPASPSRKAALSREQNAPNAVSSDRRSLR